ncbi:ATP-binding protein [Planctomicrobium sp. SH668]|uniref:ATP-binding protein n=1 Tax=Planctomicrobium sp. SH668 TaxID=3448126 RepID=UPI003F5C4281
MAKSFDFEIVFPSETNRGYEVQEKILNLLEEYHYTPKDHFSVKLALEEALINAIKHGNGLDPEKQVIVRYSVDEIEARIEIQDEGEGFNLDDVPDPTEDDNLERPSGRGVMLMRAFMTSVTYNETGNLVTMVKARTNAEPED